MSNKLTKEERQVLELSSRMSHGSAAKQLGVSLAAVKKRYKRALKKLSETEQQQAEYDEDVESFGLMIDGHPVEVADGGGS